MIFNNTKVIQARLHFRKETGALIEVFLMEPAEPTDYELMFQTTGQAYVNWLPCLQKIALVYCALISLGFIFVALWSRYVAVL